MTAKFIMKKLDGNFSGKLRVAACTATFIVLHLLGVAPLGAEVFVGLRTWHASWTPGILKSNRERAETQPAYGLLLLGYKSISYIPQVSENVAGAYQGPLVSYITEDRKFSFSLVGLYGKSGEQGFSEVTHGEFGNFVTSDVRSSRTSPHRTDLDSTVGYAVMPQLKVFAGFKFQKYNYEITPLASGTRVGIVDNADKTGKEFARGLAGGSGSIEMGNAYRGPVGGFAFSQPIGEHSSLAISLGYFRARGETELKTLIYGGGMVSGATRELIKWEIAASKSSKPLSMRGTTAELTLTTHIVGSLYLQFGYRGQYSVMKTDFAWEPSLNFSSDTNSSAAEKTTGKPPFALMPGFAGKYNDTFHGFSFSILYKI